MGEFMLKYYLILILIMSIISFALFGIDKRKAKSGSRRIPEKTLFGFAIFGGATGAFFGMQTFRHKTKHNSFRFGIPALMIIQAGLLLLIALKFAV